MRRTSVLAASLSAAALLLTGCAASSGGGTNAGAPGTTTPGPTSAASDAPAGGSSTSAAADCSPSSLKTYRAGTLTVATDSPAYEPWFKDDKPSNGKGYESAVAFAIAKQLGYTPEQVRWTVEAFNSAIAPTPKKFDFDVNQVSITPERAKVVDFSSGYYDVAQAVIALKSDKYAKATSIAGLKGARLGAQKGTTSLDAILQQIKPGTTPSEFPTNNLAVQALKNGQIDGLVVDLPTGLYITAAELDNSTIIGQLPVTGTPEQFGAVLDKRSPLTACVSKAIDALRADGTLKALQQQWLTSAAGAPELR
ncbi:MAG: ABC transporter substrate-binding protein [Jatrophihabitans sp.]|uniref:ABC transporter substrate-binding protein n=1 Tax=Jatrophihabitans sp. TaxID=1932789 RepID=UPI003F7D05C9